MTAEAIGAPSLSTTSTSLLDQVKVGDQQAWERLVKLYGPLVYAWCRRWGIQPNDAADVAQEVFRAVAGSIQGFRKDRPNASFRGWLWTIARHEACDHFSRLAKSPQVIGGTDLQLQLAEISEQCADGDDDPEELAESTAWSAGHWT